MIVRRLGAADLDAFMALRREALEREPLAFGSDPESDRMRTPEAARETLSSPDGHAVFGAVTPDGSLAGIAGVMRLARPKTRHRASIWGMYVRSDQRGRGAGRALLEAAVACARDWPGVRQVELGVTEAAAAALALYESMGFVRWGTEPRALVWDGREVAQHLLVLDFEPDASG